MVGIIPNTTQMVDQGSVLNFQATTANDTTNKGAGGGVTWTLTGSGCAGTGCGTLTNVESNSVTYTAPSGDTATLTVTLKATSKVANNATASVTISVVLPPTFNLTQVLPGGTNGTAYSQQIQVTNGVTPLLFSLSPGNTLPAGLTLNSTGLISGRPTGPTPPNPTAFTVVVTDNANPPAHVTSPQYSIAINPAPTLAVTQTSPLPPATLNRAYGFKLATSGGIPPFNWSILSGCLPSGLQLAASTGLVSGTPLTTAPCGGGATSQFTPQVTDSSIPPQTQSSASPLVIAVNTAPALSVVGGPLPAGSVASPYSASIGITGGIPPYQNIVLTSGQLPSGLILNPTTGVITGSPVLTGTSTFSVQVEDSATPPNVASSPPANRLTIAIAQGTTDPNTLLSGSYSFLFNGYDASGAVAIAGFFDANGAGKITGGAEDVNRESAITIDATISGSYSITPDGRGTMQLTATDSQGRMVTAGYRLVLDSSGNARFFEDDTILVTPPLVPTHGAGSIKLQQGSSFAASTLGGNYAFAFSGPDLNDKPVALVGTIHSDQSGNLNPGMVDFNDGGAYSGALALSGNYSVLSATGRGEASLVFQPAQVPQVTLEFVFYIVSSTDAFFVEVDTPDSTHPRLSGEMIQQQPGVVFNSTALSGPGVVSGSGTGASASVFVGLLSPCNAGGVCLTYTENNGGTISNPVAPFNSGTFSVANNGRVDFTTPAGAPTIGPRVVAAYLTGQSQGFIIGSDAAATTGLLEQQTGGNPNFSSASVFDGYTLGAPITADSLVKNIAGQVTAVTVAGNSTISGTLDEADPAGTVNIGSQLTAGFTIANAATGQGTFTTNAPPGIPTNLVFYIVSPSKLRAVSVDSIDQHPEVIFFDH